MTTSAIPLHTPPALPPTPAVSPEIGQGGVVQLDLHTPPLNVPGLTRNALLVTALTAATVFINRHLGNDAIVGTKAEAEGANLLVNFISANLINHIVKGNIRSVDSHLKQLAALVTLVGGTVILDAIAGAVTKTGPLSEATAIAVANAAGHLIKLMCYKVIGQPSYLHVNSNQGAPQTLETQAKHRKWTYWMGGATALCSAVANQFISTGTGLSSILSIAYSQAFRKIGKAALKVSPTTEEKLKAVKIQFALSLLASVAVGGVFAYRADTSGSWPQVLVNTAVHYLGATSAVSTFGYFCDQRIRAKDKKASTAATEHAPQPAGKKPPSRLKRILHPIGFLATNVVAATVNAANFALSSVKPNAVVALATKQWDQGLTFHSLREILKGKDGGWQRAAYLTAAAGTVVATQLVANTIQTDGTGVTAMAIGLGSVAAFVGKWVRNSPWFLPKPKPAAASTSLSTELVPPSLAAV